ncbi:putative transposase [Vibrio cholerae]|nr:putative transposase [Vibrio cholerae]
MYRVKQLLGGKLSLRNYNAQVGETDAMIKALNKLTGLGMQKWTPLVGHISSFLKWLTQLMLRIFAYRSRPHQE